MPAALFAVWYLFYGGEGSASTNLAGPASALHYGLDMAAASVAGLGGLSLDWGRPLLVASLVGLVAALARRRPSEEARLLAVGAGAVGFWVLTGVTRADFQPPVPPDTSRYLYVSGALLLLLAAGVLAGTALGRRAAAALAVGVAVLCVMNLGVLGDGGNGLRDTNRIVRVELAAVEAAAGRVDRNFLVDPQRAPAIPAGSYLDAIDDFGSPAYSIAEVRRNVIPDAAAIFDGALVRALGAAPQPAGPVPTSATPPAVEAAIGGQSKPEGACQAFASGGAGAALDVAVPANGLVVSTDPGPPVELRFRRLATQYGGPPTFTLPGGSAPARFTIPPDRLGGAWHLRLSPNQAVRVCAAG